VPEGDTVHLAATRLHAALAGQVLTRADLRVPRLATVDLAGRAVAAVAARGKHLLMRLDGPPPTSATSPIVPGRPAPAASIGRSAQSSLGAATASPIEPHSAQPSVGSGSVQPGFSVIRPPLLGLYGP